MYDFVMRYKKFCREALLSVLWGCRRPMCGDALQRVTFRLVEGHLLHDERLSFAWWSVTFFLCPFDAVVRALSRLYGFAAGRLCSEAVFLLCVAYLLAVCGVSFGCVECFSWLCGIVSFGLSAGILLCVNGGNKKTVPLLKRNGTVVIFVLKGLFPFMLFPLCGRLCALHGRDMCQRVEL